MCFSAYRIVFDWGKMGSVEVSWDEVVVSSPQRRGSLHDRARDRRQQINMHIFLRLLTRESNKQYSGHAALLLNSFDFV